MKKLYSVKYTYHHAKFRQPEGVLTIYYAAAVDLTFKEVVSAATQYIEKFIEYDIHDRERYLTVFIKGIEELGTVNE